MTTYYRVVAGALGALILALPASAADPTSAQPEKKRPTVKARYISGSGVILLRTGPQIWQSSSSNHEQEHRKQDTGRGRRERI